jgi:hypothetical protein
VKDLPKSVWVERSVPSSSSVEGGIFAKILRIRIESGLWSPSGVSRFWLVGIHGTLPQSG